MKLKDHRALSTQNTHMSTCDLGSDWLLQRSCLVPRKRFQPIRAQSFSPNGPWFRSLKDLVSICCLHVPLRLQKTKTGNISFPLLVESGRPQLTPELVLFPLILLSTEQTLRPSCGCLLPLLLHPPLFTLQVSIRSSQGYTRTAAILWNSCTLTCTRSRVRPGGSLKMDY